VRWRIAVPWAVPAGLAASLLCVLSTPPAHAEHLVAALSSSVVQITSNFTGVELTLFGAVEGGTAPPAGGYDIVATVTGPRQSAVARQKERVAGVWINAASRTLVGVPSYLAVLSNRPFDGIADAGTLRRERVGIANVPLRLENAGRGVANADDPFRAAFVRLKKERRLYEEKTSGVEFLTPTLFRATIVVPADAVLGDYKVNVKLFAGGAAITGADAKFNIMTVGFERFISNAAANYGLAYGLATTAMAVLTGWMASILFRRD
jgi:uncharacterized protein (TIGR02186 family)